MKEEEVREILEEDDVRKRLEDLGLSDKTIEKILKACCTEGICDEKCINKHIKKHDPKPDDIGK